MICVAIPKERTRCPACHQIVPRGVRVKDSAWVAICSECGPQTVEDVHHPKPHKITRAEIEAIVGEGSSEKGGRRKGPLPNRFALISRIKMVKERTGLSWRKMSELAGQGRGFFWSQLQALETRGRVGNPDRLCRLLDLVLERAGAAENGGGADVDMLTALEEAKARTGLSWERASLAIGETRHYLANIHAAIKRGDSFDGRRLETAIARLNALADGRLRPAWDEKAKKVAMLAYDLLGEEAAGFMPSIAEALLRYTPEQLRMGGEALDTTADCPDECSR